MKVIIAGSRDIDTYDIVEKAVVESGFSITEVVSGHANGVDKLGELYAKKHNIPFKTFPAEWEKFGLGAGYRRNSEMADYAEALIAITNGSKGTANMIEIANKKHLKVFVKKLEKQKSYIDAFKESLK